MQTSNVNSAEQNRGKVLGEFYDLRKIDLPNRSYECMYIQGLEFTLTFELCSKQDELTHVATIVNF